MNNIENLICAERKAQIIAAIKWNIDNEAPQKNTPFVIAKMTGSDEDLVRARLKLMYVQGMVVPFGGIYHLTSE